MFTCISDKSNSVEDVGKAIKVVNFHKKRPQNRGHWLVLLK